MYLILSIITGLGFGASLFLRKLGVKYIGMTAFILETIMEAILAIITIAIFFPFNITDIMTKPLGTIFGVAAGISITVGVLSFFLAVKYGPALIPSILGPILAAITASLLTIIFLRETLTFIKLFGLVITLAGLVIFLYF